MVQQNELSVLKAFAEINSNLTSPFPKQQVLDSSNLKELTDNNFELDENGRKFSKLVENTVGKGEIAHYELISPFPVVFSKDLYYRHVKIRACLGKG